MTGEIETLRIDKGADMRVVEIRGEPERVIAGLEHTLPIEELEEARAALEAAHERAETARETEIAERGKRVELINAEREAERDARVRRITTEAEHALAATAADTRRVAAVAEAAARPSEAQGHLASAKAEADGARLRHEAHDTLDEAHVAAGVRQQMLTSLPAIIQARADPLKSVGGLRVVKVDGLTRGGAGSGETGAPGGLARDVLQSTLDYPAQAPLVDRLVREVGLGGFDEELAEARGGAPGTPAPRTRPGTRPTDHGAGALPDRRACGTPLNFLSRDFRPIPLSGCGPTGYDGPAAEQRRAA